MAPIKPSPTEVKRPVVLTPEERAELSQLIETVGIPETCRQKVASRSLILGAVATGRMSAAGYALVFGSKRESVRLASSLLAEANRVGGRF